MKLKDQIKRIYNIHGPKKNCRRISALGAGIVAIGCLGLTGCISDGLQPCPDTLPGAAGEVPYRLAIVVNMPQDVASRGTTDQSGNTSSDGTQAAEANESKINSINLIFCEVKEEGGELQGPEQDSYLYNVSGSTFTQTEPVKGNDGSIDSKITIQIGDPDQCFGQLANKKVRLYVVANYSVEADVRPHNAYFTYASPIGNNPLGFVPKGGSVLPLSNAQASQVLDFTGMDSDAIKAYILALSENTLNMSSNNTTVGSAGVINLQRAVARIDFRGHEEPETQSKNGGTESEGDLFGKPALRSRADDKINSESNLYKLTASTETFVRVESMQLFNISKEAYLFHHTVTGDNNSANFTGSSSLFGDERGTVSDKYNWIADRDWAATDQKSKNFFHPFSTTYAKNETNVKVMDFLKDENNNPYEYKADTYHPAWYVSENTIPSTELMSAENLAGYATGILFRVAVCDVYGDKLTKEKPSAGVPKEVEYGKDASGNTIITITMPNGDWQEVAYTENDDEKGFYLTYYGILAHNRQNDWTSDNGLNPMHYGVVRNNVYQVSVESIRTLPNPEQPRNMFLDLTINVLSWCKRDIGVEF